jgi:hypothetical protein
MERLHDVACGSVELHVWDSYIDLMEANVSTNACAGLPYASPDGWLQVIRASIFDAYGYLALRVSAHMYLYPFHLFNRSLDLPLSANHLPGIVEILSLAGCIHINNIQTQQRRSTSCIRSRTSTHLPPLALLAVHSSGSTSQACQHGSIGTSISSILITRTQTRRAA